MLFASLIPRSISVVYRTVVQMDCRGGGDDKLDTTSSTDMTVTSFLVRTFATLALKFALLLPSLFSRYLCSADCPFPKFAFPLQFRYRCFSVSGFDLSKNLRKSCIKVSSSLFDLSVQECTVSGCRLLAKRLYRIVSYCILLNELF